MKVHPHNCLCRRCKKKRKKHQKEEKVVLRVSMSLIVSIFILLCFL